MPERRANSSQKLLPRRSRSSTVQGRGGKWLKRQTVRVLEVLIKGLERLVEQLESETAPEKIAGIFPRQWFSPPLLVGGVVALVMIILSAGGFFSHPDNQSLPEGSIPGNLTLETPTFETPTFEAPTFETPTSETSILKNSTPQNIQAQTEPNLAAGIAPTTLSPGQPLDSSVNGSINNSTDSELSSSQGSNSESNSTAILEPSTVEETSENQPTPNSVNSPEMNQSAELTPIPAELLAIAPPEAVQLSNPLILQPNLKQILLNSIQARITQKFRFAEPSLILAIQAKFIDSLLQVQLSAQWYQLRENQQDRLVQELWKQAKKSEFSKLAVTNSEDKLIARNPIIGSEMIILERQLNREFLTNNSP